MAVSLEGLNPNFREKVEMLLSSLLRLGVEMRPCAALRTPEEQAKLWRQSRSKEEIVAATSRLQENGARYLADILERVGPQHGQRVTNSLPGLSWHQWGEAADCFWAINGVAEWSASQIVDGINGYQVYAGKGKALGLDAGGLWKTFKDWPHLQVRSVGSPILAGYSLADIDATMQERFS
ncbi:M15 family metallopeptidase [Rhizobium laguerreae]|uniref:M15 family metallopeptidase n=1 Tax=Rhizobium laguerreae TaxID=1076926 RepID=UPI001E315FB5|nr:M15 family metallopeptidase [Rhizobium laguerreae]UFW64309.1 M15 family metallopeptidase [Rhizobium laguerreae]